MYTDKDFAKLFDTPGVRFSSIKHFMSDKRLTEPFGLMGHTDYTRHFGEFEIYPEALSEVIYNNGF